MISKHDLAIGINAIWIASIALFVPISVAHAGCGEWSGQARVCYKDRCEKQQGERQCSSAGSGQAFVTTIGYQFWFDDYVAGFPTILTVERQDRILFKGDPRSTPWSIWVCGKDTIFNNACGKNWVNPATGEKK
jgi:hypothetical protein